MTEDDFWAGLYIVSAASGFLFLLMQYNVVHWIATTLLEGMMRVLG